jgi:hypothetical protein
MNANALKYIHAQENLKKAENNLFRELKALPTQFGCNSMTEFQILLSKAKNAILPSPIQNPTKNITPTQYQEAKIERNLHERKNSNAPSKAENTTPSPAQNLNSQPNGLHKKYKHLTAEAIEFIIQNARMGYNDGCISRVMGATKKQIASVRKRANIKGWCYGRPDNISKTFPIIKFSGQVYTGNSRAPAPEPSQTDTGLKKEKKSFGYPPQKTIAYIHSPC